jgi:hypothetical protein
MIMARRGAGIEVASYEPRRVGDTDALPGVPRRGQPRNDRMDFEGAIQDKYFCAQTANGTAHATGTGHNKAETYSWGGEVEPGPTRPAGRSNRTAE